MQIEKVFKELLNPKAQMSEFLNKTGPLAVPNLAKNNIFGTVSIGHFIEKINQNAGILNQIYFSVVALLNETRWNHVRTIESHIIEENMK